MPFTLVKRDITTMHTDAIVNAANSSLLGGGGVDGAIHRAAGPGLLEECRTLHGCVTGDAKITKGYDLPARYVIHTVGPIYEDGHHSERELLYSCYRKSLELADSYRLESIAFPLISAGAYGYPQSEALAVATEAITEFLKDHEMDVYMVLYSVRTRLLDRDLYNRIRRYLDENYEDENPEFEEADRRSRRIRGCRNIEEDLGPIMMQQELDLEEAAIPDAEAPDLTGAFMQKDGRFRFDLDESFSDMLLRMIRERGMTDAECYKKANIDRKLFSKIRSNVNYRPSKSTVCAFAIALELNLEDAEAMLASAGFAFSPASIFDQMIKFFITNREYSVIRINEALYDYDQPLLGSLPLKA